MCIRFGLVLNTQVETVWQGVLKNPVLLVAVYA